MQRAGSKPDQREVGRLIARLQEHPFEEAFYSEPDETGRHNQVAVAGGLLVHYWNDHAERTVRVTRIESVD